MKYLLGAAVFVFYAFISCYGLYLLKDSPSIWSSRFLTGGVFYALGAAIWVAILKFFPLSFAFPIAASALMIGTSLTGYVFLGERITPVHIAGMALILVGVFLISTTTGKS